MSKLFTSSKALAFASRGGGRGTRAVPPVASGRGRVRISLVVGLFAVTAALVQVGTALAVPAKPPTDTSYYVKYPYNGTGTPDISSNAYARGCSQGTFDTNHSNANSEVVLDFGAQNASNTGTYLPKTNTPATYANVEHYAETFAYGYWVCTGNTNTTSVLQLSLGTNNSGSLVTSAGGSGWAGVVNDVVNWTSTGTYSYLASQVYIVGGGDIEPAWSSQSAAIAWTDGYDGVITAPFYINFGSCDGCPNTAKTGNGYSFTPCSGCSSWDQYGVWNVAYGEPDALPLPEIYVSPQQTQWAAISDYGYIAHGSAVYFQGPLDEYPLATSTYTATQAWTNFWNALQGFGGVTAQTPPYSSEINDANS